MSLTVANLIDERVKLNAAARAAILEFKRAKPWRGTFEERRAKFEALRVAFNDAYGLDVAMEFVGAECTDRMGDGAFDTRSNRIVLVGKLSVVTFLHCFARARGMDRKGAFRWSLSLFKRFFPISFGRCRQVGPFLVRA